MKKNPFDYHSEEYETWFQENKILFHSELLALKKVIPNNQKGLEIGIGSGIFAEKLQINYGIDPAESMLKIARKRKLEVELGQAEALPYLDQSFDFTAFITSLCFIEDALKALKEAYRVTRENGNLIIAFIDKESLLGKTILARKDKSKFYQNAHFYSVPEISALLEKANFEIMEIYQTLIKIDKNEIEKPIRGFGKGSFVVIKAGKKLLKQE